MNILPLSTADRQQLQFAQDLGQNTARGLGKALFGDQEAEAIKRMTGQDVRGLSPEMRKELLKQEYGFRREEAKAGREAEKLAGKEQIKINGLKNALGRVSQMESILDKGNLGLGSGFTKFLSKDTQTDIGDYETLGKSLIQFASTIPIRNRSEFDTLAEKLYRTDQTQETMRGVLKGLKRIISDSLSEYDIDPESVDEKPKSDGFKMMIAPNGKRVRIPEALYKQALSEGAKDAD